MREPPFLLCLCISYTRITPACAGTTCRLRIGEYDREDHPRVWDHPRVCGNHLTSSSCIEITRGSPPRVREPLTLIEPLNPASRITPACAGTTGSGGQHQGTHRDHPRVCGNHSFSRCFCFLRRGSPPRVREPPTRSTPQTTSSRITPACAGTTTGMAKSLKNVEDHPRVCGNHFYCTYHDN